MSDSTDILPAELAERLLAWYDQTARDLPWRHDREPYHVWLSEIMLQQTRVETVKAYYLRFLDTLPDVQSLANASEETLMKLWAGLGYYRRMRLLHECAKKIVEEHGGRFPETAEGLRKLPGIGDYTAGAIASIAFEQPAPAVDGNVLRVLSRLTASDNWNTANAGKALRSFYAIGNCGNFTQSLMELGAVVCLPNGAPRCGDCPLQDLCLACRDHVQATFPPSRAKTARKVEKLQVYLLRCHGKIALRKRGNAGVLAGLWELPNTPLKEASSPEQYGTLLRKFSAKHVFTHLEWHMLVVEIEVPVPLEKFVWIAPADAILPSAFRKLLDQ